MKKATIAILAALLTVAQGLWAQTIVETETDLLNAVQNSQTVKLGKDITTASQGGRLGINNGVTVTLDLNGHMLKRQMTAADDGGQVIYIANGGKLTITDSGTGGKITGGWARQGGGIYVEAGGELTISGGTITGNRSDKIEGEGTNYGYGGAIENHGTVTITGGVITGNTAGQFGGGIHNEGTLNITGGSITDNTAGTYGGGIYSNSTVSISGATISGNTAESGGGGICCEGGTNLNNVTITGNSSNHYGGGIYMFGIGTVQMSNNCTITGNTAQEGGGIFHVSNGAGVAGPTLKMQDKPVVENNAPNDVYLQSYQLITVTGAFSEETRIGVDTEIEQNVFTSGYGAYNTAAPSTYFFASNATRAGSIDWSTDNKEAKLTMTGYKYIDHTWNHSTKTLTAEEKTKANGECISLESNISGWTELSGGKWYVVNGEINIGTLVVHGTGNLILCDKARLTVTGGVKVELKDNAVLNIYGQTGNTGQLIVTNSYSKAAGIGSGGGSDDGNAGIINIHGGTIHATGNKYGAGIGGGNNHGFGPQANNSGLYVYGGSVTAQGGEYAAGIGSGDEPSDGTAGYVAVYGGTVHATGGNEAAGIGGGNEGNGAMFSIYGGTVTAQGGAEGAGIGGGDEGNSSTTTFYGGTVTATGGRRGAGIGGGRSGYATAISFHGGNITAIGGEQYSDVTAGGAAGIGGGYKGECRGIYFYGAAESVNGLPATVNATGKHGGAGIGSGYNTDFCQLDISGGNITATADGKGPGIGRGYTTTGMSRQSSDKKVLVNISGGDVTASSTNGGAGIGTGADTNFNGNINISGGKVTATGINGGAGIGTGGSIGGEKSFMYGWIVISGGEVIAKGEYNDDNSKVYWSGCGAGIGSGAAGEIYPEGLIQLLGGNVTASSMSGGAIGAGGTKVNENSQRDTWVDCPIQIHGDNTTLTLTSGQVRDMIISNNTATWAPSPVIRVHPDRGGSVSINGNLAVAMGGTISAEANRVSTLTTATEQQVTVSPCTHGSCTYTINDDTHTAHCSYCPYSVTENHAATGTCVCGYETGVYIYKVTLYTYDESNNSYSKIEQQVANGQTYEVPDCDDVPMSWEFVGWAETSTPGISFEQQTGETLIQPGETLTAATTLVARYKKIELRLTDTGTDNMVILNKYNKIKTASVTLSGRTLYKDGSWNTLCLPFDVTLNGSPLEGAIAKTLVGAEMSDNNLSLTFSEAVTTLEAGVPYIIMWNKAEGYDTADPATRDITEPVFTDVTVVSSPDADRTISLLDGAVKFVGYYDPFGITADDTDIYYMTANNTLKHTGVARTLLACRAYFQFSDESAAARQITLNFGDDETTRIIELKNSRIEELKSEDGWYTVDGVKLDKQPTRKGLYIHNGRKVVIK